MMWRSEETSYFLRTSSGSFIRRMNMVGTMKMVSIFSRSISAQKFLGIEARHQHQHAAEPPGAQAERIRRGVIERTRQDARGRRA